MAETFHLTNLQGTVRLDGAAPTSPDLDPVTSSARKKARILTLLFENNVIAKCTVTGKHDREVLVLESGTAGKLTKIKSKEYRKLKPNGPPANKGKRHLCRVSKNRKYLVFARGKLRLSVRAA